MHQENSITNNPQIAASLEDCNDGLNPSQARQPQLSTVSDSPPSYAHLVRLEAVNGKFKKPFENEWTDIPIPHNTAHPERTGVIPASLFSICIDIDNGGAICRDRIVSSLGQPWYSIESSPGRFHLYYHVPNNDNFTYAKAEDVVEFRYAKCQMRIVNWSDFWLHFSEANRVSAVPWEQIFAVIDAEKHLTNPDVLDQLSTDKSTKCGFTEKEILAHKKAGCSGNRVSIHCPNEAGHKNHDRNASGSYYLDSGFYFCGGCGLKGFANDRDSEDYVAKQDKIVVPKTYKGLSKAFEHLGFQIRFNSRWHRTEYLLPDKEEWQARTKRNESWIREQVSQHCLCKNAKGDEVPFHNGRESYATFSEALAHENQVDPFQSWLENLPEWDSTPRISNLLERLFNYKQEQHELLRWISRFLFCGAVERTYWPGSKLDETPVLIGDQQLGKSTMIEKLLPPELSSMFGGGLNLMGTDKERTESIQGRVIVEAAEFVGARRADLNSLKAFLTRTDDGIARMAYEAGTFEMPRRCIIVGTSNDIDTLPNDVTGNRRFVAVEIFSKTGISVSKLRRIINDEREMLWAEALAWWHSQDKPSARLPDELADVQAEQNEQYRSRNQVLEDVVGSALEFFEDAEFTLGQLCQHAQLATNQSKAVSGILKKAGYAWQQKRIDGKRKRVWRKEPDFG